MTESSPGIQTLTEPRPAPAKGGLVRNMMYMTTSTAFIRLGGVLFAILFRRVLGPHAVGVWNGVEILVAYLCAVTLGISYSAERMIPTLRARGDLQAIARTRDFLFTWNVVEGVVVALGTTAYAVFLGGRHPDEVRLGLYWLPALFFFQKLLSVVLILLKSDKDFRSYSIANVISTVLDWSLVLWAFLWGLPGVLSGAAFAGFVKLAYFLVAWRRMRALKVGWRLSMRELRRHLPYGPHYSLFKMMWAVGEKIDSLFVGYLLGATLLGYYYLGYQFSNLALEIPIALVYIAFPNMMEKFSVSDGGRSFSNEFFRYLRFVLFLILPVIMPLAYFGAEFLIRNFLPAFSPGITAVKINILVVGLLAIRHLYYQVLMAHKRINHLMLVTVIQLLAFVGLYFALRNFFRDPLIAVAVANCLAYAGHLALTLWLTRPFIQKGATLLHGSGISLVFCFIWAGLLVTVNLLAPWPLNGQILHDFGQSLLRIIGFAVLAAPIAYLGLGPDRQKIVRRLLEIFKNAAHT